MSVAVRRAGTGDLARLAPLFTAYRGFYTGAPEPEASRDFLQARLERDESVVLVAEDGGHVLGFTQLYPTFSSVRAARVWVLNDLYVDASARRRGAARALLDAAAAFAAADGAVRLELETTPDNATAQALYAAAGWARYEGTLRYHLVLDRG